MRKASPVIAIGLGKAARNFCRRILRIVSYIALYRFVCVAFVQVDKFLLRDGQFASYAAQAYRFS